MRTSESCYKGPGVDDHSRVAYAEIHDDETAATAIGVLRREVDRAETRMLHRGMVSWRSWRPSQRAPAAPS
jgi:hypothetical protein